MVSIIMFIMLDLVHQFVIQDLAQESAAYAGRHEDGESVTMVALLSSGEQINRGTLIV